MNDVDSLVEACIAEPADAAVRSVLADALEEKGDPRAVQLRTLLRWWERAAALAIPAAGSTDVKRIWKRVESDDLRWLWACLCARFCPTADGRRVWDLLSDPRSQHGIAVAELSWCSLVPSERLRMTADAAYTAWRIASRVFAEEQQPGHDAHAAYAAYMAIIGAPLETAHAAATSSTAGVGLPASASGPYRSAHRSACRWAVALAALLRATPP